MEHFNIGDRVVHFEGKRGTVVGIYNAFSVFVKYDDGTISLGYNVAFTKQKGDNQNVALQTL